MQIRKLAAAGLARFKSYLSAIGPAIRRLTRSNERASRHSMERVHLIAHALTPAEDYDIKTVTLQKRQRSRLYRHEIYTGGGDAALTIIEKQSNNSREHGFYACIAEASRDAQTEIAPEVYSIYQNSLLGAPEFRNHIFLEHLPSIGLPDLSETTAINIAHSMIKIAEFSIGETRGIRQAPKRFNARFLEEFVEAVTQNGHLEATVSAAKLQAMKADWHMLSERDLGSTRLVLCHNDLHRLNVGRRGRNRSGDFVFFDWEQFAFNHLGSDLHHFVSSGLIMPDWSRFSATLQNEYCRLAEQAYGARRQDIDFAAYSFGLYKCMMRSIRRKKDALQIRAAVALFDRLRAIPCIIATVFLGEVVYTQ